MLFTSCTKCFEADERAAFIAKKACKPSIFSDVFELTIRVGAAKPKPVSLDKGFQSLTVEEVEKLQRRSAWLLGADLPLTHG